MENGLIGNSNVKLVQNALFVSRGRHKFIMLLVELVHYVLTKLMKVKAELLFIFQNVEVALCAVYLVYEERVLQRVSNLKSENMLLSVFNKLSMHFNLDV